MNRPPACPARGFPKEGARESWPFRSVASLFIAHPIRNQSIHTTPALRRVLPTTVVQSPAHIRMSPCYPLNASLGRDVYKCVAVLCCAGMPVPMRGFNFPLGQASQQQEPMSFRMLNGGNTPIPTSSRYAFITVCRKSTWPRNARLILIL